MTRGDWLGVGVALLVLGALAWPKGDATVGEVAATARETIPPSAPDGTEIVIDATLARVPPSVALAVAWHETRHSRDSTVRSPKGALGRFQIMDATARARCPDLDVRTTHGNRACFLRMVRADFERCGGWRCAIRIHNGRGRAAEQFATDVMATVGELELQRRGTP
jgi:hypothetical protein